MRIHGDKTEDVLIVEKILWSLTPKFNVVCVIEEANDVRLLSIDELQSSLLVHEQKINQQEKKEQALKALSENHFTPSRANWGRGRDVCLSIHWCVYQSEKVCVRGVAMVWNG